MSNHYILDIGGGRLSQFSVRVSRCVQTQHKAKFKGSLTAYKVNAET